MPCSSTEDGAWVGCLASSSRGADLGACTAAGSSHTSNSRRSQQRQQWETGGTGAASCRVSCSSSSDRIVDNDCSDSAAVEALALDGSHIVAVVGAPRLASPSATPVAPLPPLKPMQLAAAAAAASAAAQDKNCGGNGSDGDSDLDFFTPLSSPLRELPTPSMPVAAAAQGSAAGHHQQQQPGQQQKQPKKLEQQLLQRLAPVQMSGSNEHGSPLLLRSITNNRQQHSTSTSSLPPAKECGLLLDRLPLRRRYMSTDCGSSLLHREPHQEQHLHPCTQAATAAAVGAHFLTKSCANGAASKDRAPQSYRISRAPLQSRRCQGRALQYHQKKHQFQWVQQDLLEEKGQLQRRQQQDGLQREASDEDIRMPLVPPPASSSPLLASSRVAPPTVNSVSFHTEEGAAVTAAAADYPVGTDSREAVGVGVGELSNSSNSAVLAEGEKQQLNSPSILLTPVRLHQPQREGQVTQQWLAFRPQQQQQQTEDTENLLQCSKRRRYSVERNESACALPTVQAAAVIPASACIHSNGSSSGREVLRQPGLHHMESVARVEEIDFSSHRKRKRGGECSARLLLMLQPNASSADAALLDVLGTALTAEETRELRMQQQKAAEEAAAAAAAAEEAARERTAAAAAAEAAAARAKAAQEAEEVATRAKAQADASQAAIAAAAVTSTRLPTKGPQNTRPQARIAAEAAVRTSAGGTALFGTMRPAESDQQLPQHALADLQQMQSHQPQEQVGPQTQQPQLQQEKLHGQKLQGTAGNTSGLGELGALPGRPKLRIRRANGASGAAPSLTAAFPAISVTPPQRVGFQQQQQPSFAPQTPSVGQQPPLQQQMDVQGSVFQPSQVQQHQQYSQQPQLQQQAQQQQPAADGLGLGLAEFGPTKVPDVTDAGEAFCSALRGTLVEFFQV